MGESCVGVIYWLLVVMQFGMIKFLLIVGYDFDFVIDVFDDVEVFCDEDVFVVLVLCLFIGLELVWMMYLYFYGYISYLRSYEIIECFC